MLSITSRLIRSPNKPLASRVRWHATLPDPGVPPITDTNRAETTRKRFWKTVSIGKHPNGFSTVTLDNRPLKTPSGNALLLPPNKGLVAALMAAEWEQQQDLLLKPHALPMTSLAMRALDGLAGESTRADVRASVLQYLDTDTICFFQDDPPPLVRLQEKYWDPILNWTRATFDVRIHTSHSILPATQPDDTKHKFRAILADLDHWELAAMEHAANTTKSFLIALALVKGYITVEEAAFSAHVEVSSQTERWGEVEDSHDIDYQDIRRQLGSAACLLSHT